MCVCCLSSPSYCFFLPPLPLLSSLHTPSMGLLNMPLSLLPLGQGSLQGKEAAGPEEEGDFNQHTALEKRQAQAHRPLGGQAWSLLQGH